MSLIILIFVDGSHAHYRPIWINGQDDDFVGKPILKHRARQIISTALPTILFGSDMQSSITFNSKPISCAPSAVFIFLIHVFSTTHDILLTEQDDDFVAQPVSNTQAR